MADFTAGHTLVIQKHYEFYLANKILKKFIIIHELHIHSLGLFALTAFTLTVPLALCADVISEHCAENEVLFRRKHVERAGQHQAYGVKTLGPTEKKGSCGHCQPAL